MNLSQDVEPIKVIFDDKMFELEESLAEDIKSSKGKVKSIKCKNKKRKDQNL